MEATQQLSSDEGGRSSTPTREFIQCGERVVRQAEGFDRIHGPFVDTEHVEKVDDVENDTRLRRLSCTAPINSLGDDAASTDPSVPRLAPTLVTMTRSSG
jgi:hypothetical protein